MKLSTPRYSLSLFFQLTFVLCDLIFNCVSLFPRSRDGLLVLFIFQDLFLLLSITSMLMSLFSTYLFQAGLVEVLVRKFRAAAAGAALYLASSLALQAAWLATRYHPSTPSTLSTPDTPALLALFTLHRCLSPWYYFLYKRCALRVSDPRFYEDVDWIDRPRRLQPR